MPYLDVSTPVGDLVMTNRVYRSRIVTIEDREFLIHLTVLGIQDFGAILRMDRLLIYHAKLNYSLKVLTFPITEGQNLQFISVKRP